ncbi:hypothetical protein [Streptomyces wuyuanensis]|uniref:hypothetical protein n=1 Tax=Streptomyces wuyuanensis TaxID=1196353 RepID=UPI003D720AFE
MSDDADSRAAMRTSARRTGEDLRLFTTRFIRQVEALDDVRYVVAAPPDNGDGAAMIRRTS